MKILKLSLIFLATLVVVVGALWLTIGGSSNSEILEPNDKFRKQSDEIEAQWQNMTPWRREAYENKIADLNQKKQNKSLTSSECDQLKEQLRTAAINRLYTLAILEFKKHNCQADIVKNYYTEANTFLTEKRQNEDSLQKLCRIYKLYTDIHNFVGSTYKPDFNGKCWTSLDTHLEKALQMARDYRSNADYMEFLSNIKGFAEGLKDAAVRSKVNNGRAEYYERLSDQIIKHFNKQERTRDAAAKLDSIYSTFYNEYSGVIKSLYDFNKDFQADAQRAQ